MEERLAEFLAEVVLTSHYLAEPLKKTTDELSDAEMRCLRVITSFEPLSMHDIAEKLHASKPRTTQLVAWLEAHDMIERTVAKDRRRIEVRTSSNGRETIRILQERYQKLAHAIQQKLGAKDTEKLCKLLEEITPLSRLSVD